VLGGASADGSATSSSSGSVVGRDASCNLAMQSSKSRAISCVRWVDLIGASRAYQANLTAISLIRDLVSRALELGR